MKKKFVYIKEEIFFNLLTEENRQTLCERILSASYESPAPKDRLSDVQDNCHLPLGIIKFINNRYGRGSTTFRDHPGISFTFSTQQILWWFFKGPTNGKQVQHKCGVHACRNINHLTLGPSKKNGIHASDTRKPRDIDPRQRTWKLCPIDKIFIDYLDKEDLCSKDIGKIVGVNQNTINLIKRKILNSGSYFLSKVNERHYLPPTKKDMVLWVKRILRRIIYTHPFLGYRFTLKDLQEMFEEGVGFKRSLAWYCNIIQEL